MFYFESVARINVRKLRRSDIVFSNDAGNPRECELKLFRFRRQRHKQSVLNNARFRRNRFKPNFANCSARRTCFKRQHEETRDHARVSRRHRKTQRNNERFVWAFALEFKMQFQSGQPAAAQPQEQDIAKPVQDEGQRLQRREGIVQFHHLFEMQRFFTRTKWP